MHLAKGAVTCPREASRLASLAFPDQVNIKYLKDVQKVDLESKTSNIQIVEARLETRKSHFSILCQVSIVEVPEGNMSWHPSVIREDEVELDFPRTGPIKLHQEPGSSYDW